MKRRLLVRAAAAGAAVLAVGMASAWLILRDRISLDTPPPTLLFEDVRGRYIAELSRDENRLGYWALPEALPDRIVKATLAAEDARYWEHRGVDWRAVVRAAWQNLREMRVVSGASTVAMQVARIQHPAERGLVSKMAEAIVAEGLVRRFGHDAVLRQYLQIAPYGNRNHGIVYAARRYFAKPVEDLTWAEAALLAALPRLPGRMNLYRFDGWHAASGRARYVLDRLLKLGVITASDHAEALSHLPGLRPAERPARPSVFLHAILEIRKEMDARPDLWRSGVRPIVRTSLDLDLQQDVSYATWELLRGFRRDGAGNAAVIVAEKESGRILAYVGSDDYYDVENMGSINYAAVPRSSGSTLKPFIYALGMQTQGYTAATILDDVGIGIDGRTGAYTFRNFDEQYLGPVLFRNALANSRNIPAVQVLHAVGLDAAYRQFTSLGLTAGLDDPRHYGLGMAIGGLYVTLEDLVRAYGALAADGRELDLKWFDEGDADTMRREPRQLIPADIARQITLFLSDPMARLPSFPRMGALEYPFPVAVKTGTSKGYRDAWCVAYTEKHLIGAWVGHPDNYAMKKRCGADSAALIVRRVIEELHPEEMSGQRDISFPAPPGFVTRRICMLTGKLADDATQYVALEWFRRGTEPVEESRAYRQVKDESGRVRTVVAIDPRYASWAKQSGIEVVMPDDAGGQQVRLRAGANAEIAVLDPPDGAALAPDPESPREYSTIPLEARVDPPVPQVVWYVDGKPYQVVDYPYTTRWLLAPGQHTFQVRLPYAQVASAQVNVRVEGERGR